MIIESYALNNSKNIIINDTGFHEVYYSGWILRKMDQSGHIASYAEFGVYSIVDKIFDFIPEGMGININKSTNHCGAPIEAEQLIGGDSLSVSSFRTNPAFRSGKQLEMRK